MTAPAATATIISGEAGAVLRSMLDQSFDALVTDPPAGIAFMAKRWDNHGGRDGFIAALTPIFRECLRVLKPGAHGAVWALPRTSGWTQRALEDAGFEIRDVGTHLFGQGFPKSLNVSKAIDRAAGERPHVVGHSTNGQGQGWVRDGNAGYKPEFDLTTPATAAAAAAGFGTALKPAAEFWILVRKPLSEDTVAANLKEHGTGVLNIDASRIGSDTITSFRPAATGAEKVFGDFAGGEATMHSGRWPANITLAHHAFCELIGVRECRAAFSEDGPTSAELVEVWDCIPGCAVLALDGQSAGASRFFYVAKPSASEKNMGITTENVRSQERAEPIGQLRNSRPDGYYTIASRNSHPTVKPVALMRWLVRLVTPPGGAVLDPFGGSGTTGVAAIHENNPCTLIEREPEYVEIMQARIARAYLGPEPDEPPPILPSEDSLSLFDWAPTATVEGKQD